MNFKEHNNRKIANKYAEYITGNELRLYMKKKVEKYLGTNKISVFDGAIGSGQLEQYLNINFVFGCDIQQNAVITAKENFKNSNIKNISFFNYKEEILTDCVVMNPPFSLQFKDLSEKEKENIKLEFEWKKNGKLDDIFVLKSLKYTKRYAFYICFPGIAYRKTEQKLRELIGNRLLELNTIENAFEDTNISVLFLVIDKTKTTNKISKELYNCKTKEMLATEESILNNAFDWEQIRIFQEKEKIKPLEQEEKARKQFLEYLEKQLVFSKFVSEMEKIDFQPFIKEIEKVLKKFKAPKIKPKYENQKLIGGGSGA